MRTVDRILCTSDLHGQNKKFLSLLKTAAYEPDKDLLVVCGDLIDRGEENLAIINTCMDLQKQGNVIIKGNHEQFLEICLREMIVDGADGFGDVFTDNFMVWVGRNGGATTYEEIKDLPRRKLIEIYDFVKNLPTYYTNGKFIFSHAGADTRKPIESNNEDDLVWMEDGFPSCPAYKDKVMVFGHTPTWLLHTYTPNSRKNKEYRKSAKIWFDEVNKDKVGIDCGGVFGGRLAMLELPSYRQFYE